MKRVTQDGGSRRAKNSWQLVQIFSLRMDRETIIDFTNDYFLQFMFSFTHAISHQYKYIIHQYRNGLYSRLGNPFSPGFPTGSTNPGLKGPSFSPGFSLGTKPTGTKEASWPGHVGWPFSPGWYYQPGLKVSFFSFCFYFQLMIRFGFRIRILRCQ